MDYKRIILSSAFSLLVSIACFFGVYRLGWISDWRTCVFIPVFVFVLEVSSQILKKKSSKKYPSLSDADSRELDKILK